MIKQKYDIMVYIQVTEYINVFGFGHSLIQSLKWMKYSKISLVLYIALVFN